MNHFEEILKEHSEEVVDLGRDLNLKIGDSPSVIEEFRPRFSYDLLSYNKDVDLCFSSKDFTKEDFHIYLQKMIQVSKTKLGDLMYNDTGLDFKIYPSVNKALKKIFFEMIGAKEFVESIPSFGRIGLYNSEDGSKKAPRIFFVVGHYATLHILACDPMHKIYDAK